MPSEYISLREGAHRLVRTPREPMDHNGYQSPERGEDRMAPSILTYLVTAAVWTVAGMEGQRILAAIIRRLRAAPTAS